MISSGLSKEKLRSELRSMRNRLSTYEVLKRSNDIITTLTSLPSFLNAQVVACYLSFGSEVYTHGLVKAYCGTKDILIPVVDREHRSLQLSHIRNWQELSTGAYGILEPKDAFLRIRDVEEAEMVIVPGIAFDEYGNRIGYGGGYYDSLLARADSLKVALAYDFQVLEHRIPDEPHDVRMDMILTDKRVIRTHE